MISNLYTLSYVLLLKSNFVKRIYVQIHLAVLWRQLHADGGYPQRLRIMKLEDNQYVGTEEIEKKRILLTCDFMLTLDARFQRQNQARDF